MKIGKGSVEEEGLMECAPYLICAIFHMKMHEFEKKL